MKHLKCRFGLVQISSQAKSSVREKESKVASLLEPRTKTNFFFRRALDLWPNNAYVQLNVAYLYTWLPEPHQQQQLAIADRCSIQAVRLAPSCVLVHAVRRLVRPEHNSPYLARASKIYGLNGDEMVAKYVGTNEWKSP